MKEQTWPTIQEQKAYWKTHDHGGNFLADRIAANEEHYAEENCWCYIEHGQLVAEACCLIHGDDT